MHHRHHRFVVVAFILAALLLAAPIAATAGGRSAVRAPVPALSWWSGLAATFNGLLRYGVSLMATGGIDPNSIT